ncbi:WcaF family extracellular polysaccharide biosynthesis acetyltransferase [Agriterribacter sp.]|uniref:WcaF family extracellular polysaccharide biosynthesis acetyltransferase n=1 Tax=Agriterribacter sp. TaxID=2821509 RepID=UPI002C3A44BE|nr:WcaF family extracellular polysaccharide biosynthesis acetyltransferase [Agriterribacter sp.]HTN05239.1 WcaF family extracellular polysaccharide biosynthesis acetyltransferase [Agriterribacter sp.]
MSRTDLSTYNNNWYKPTIGVGTIKQLLWYFTNTLFFINPLNPLSGLKCQLLRCFGAKLGRNVVIKPGVNIKYPWKLIVGDHCWIGEGVWIDNLGMVTLGDHVCISQGAMLLTGNHNYTKTSFDLMVKEIILEDGVWIGAKAVVCPGVTAFSHAMLSVASVANKNLEAYSIYSGNPAIMLKQRVIV